MKNKNTCVRLATIVLVLAGGLPLTAAADEVVELEMRFAGAFALDILHVVDPITGAALPSALIRTTFDGNLGKGSSQGYGGKTSFFGFVQDCLGSPGLRIDILENPLAMTFEDLSILFAEGGSGAICVDPSNGLQTFEIDIVFTGGRGRFEGATGQAVILGEAKPISSDGSFLVETGTMFGWIILPDDDGDSDSD